MGRSSLEDMLAHSSNIDVVLEWHLRNNHYPPLPVALLPVAKKAIEHGQAEEFDVELKMPDGIAFRGQKKATVRLLIETMHLEEFLNPQSEDE